MLNKWAWLIALGRVIATSAASSRPHYSISTKKNFDIMDDMKCLLFSFYIRVSTITDI